MFKRMKFKETESFSKDRNSGLGSKETVVTGKRQNPDMGVWVALGILVQSTHFLAPV